MTGGDHSLCALLTAAALLSCQTDHDALEKRPPSVAGGSGVGGAVGASGSFSQVGGADGQVASGGGHPDDESPGASLLTIVNGVVDAPGVVLCLTKLDAEGGVTALGRPLTESPFEYASNIVLSKVDGAQLDIDTLQPFVIAGELGEQREIGRPGELDLIAGAGCEAALARARAEEALVADANALTADAPGAAGEGGGAGGGVPPRLRVRGLPAIPAGTLNAGRSILYVATGCLGGATFSAAKAEEYCGAGYTERNSTSSALLVSLSRRTTFGFTGMQFVHASVATPAVSVSSQPIVGFGASGPALAIASTVSEGQVAPQPALLTNPASAYGAQKPYQVQVSVQGMPIVNYPWAEVLVRGGVAQLVDGSTYALVLLGPRPDHLQPTPIWNASAITVIPVDP